MPTRCNRWFLLQILLLAQHVSGTIMPIIRSSRVLYRWSLPVVFGVLVFRLSVWCGAEGYVSGLQAAALACWASNKICNKYHLLHLVGILFPHINDDARSKPHQVYVMLFSVLMIRTTGSLKMLLFFYQTIWFKISRYHNLVTVGHKNLNFTYANYLSVKNPCTYRHA